MHLYGSIFFSPFAAIDVSSLLPFSTVPQTRSAESSGGGTEKQEEEEGGAPMQWHKFRTNGVANTSAEFFCLENLHT